MNIRRTTKGKCRVCHDEIWSDFYTANHGPNRAVNYQYTDVVEDARSRFNEGYLFALVADTASGKKIEIICKKHLEDLQIQISETLDNN